MVTLSNLRKENSDVSARIICDVECSYTKVKELWFSVPVEYGDWLTDDVYDAFMLAMLYPAMYYKEEQIIVKGNVSEKLHFNLSRYVQSVVMAYKPIMKPVEIIVNGYQNAFNTHNGVGTGFSAGVDAFTTLYDRYEKELNPNYKITSLFFFNLGSHGGGGERARRKFYTRFNYLKKCTDRIPLPFIPLDSNLFDFYLKYWEYNAGVLCRAIGALVFQRVLRKFYIGSSYAYIELMDFWYDKKTEALNTFSENYLHPMLSTETLELITDGSQYTRSQKLERIVDYPLVKEFLNVCVNGNMTYRNCTICPKCRRTLFALDVLGKTSEFSKVFDLKIWAKIRNRYKYRIVRDYKIDVYAKDNVDFAKRHDFKMPPRFIAYPIVTSYIRIQELLLILKRYF